jgi:uncharacterized protein (DUF305 family)
MTKIDQIAQAFAQGVKFAENLKLAMDAAKGKDDEDGHWVTVREGEEARPVFIKGAKKKADKTESKKAESRKKSNLSSEDQQALRKLKTDNTTVLKDLDKIKKSLSAENIARKKYHLSKPDAEIVQDTHQMLDQIKPMSAKLVKQVTANVEAGHYSIDEAQKILVGANQTIRQIHNIGSRMYAASMHGYGSRNAMEDDHALIKGLYTKLYKANKEAESKPAQQRTERTASQSETKTEPVKALKDAYNVSADLIAEMTPKQADRPFLSRLDRIHKDAVALAESAPEINNSHELREMTRIMKQADKLVKALPNYYDRNYYGGWVQNIMGKVRAAEEAYTKLKKRKALGPDAAI